MTVTGFPREQWVYRAKQLWECDENIYLAGLNEDGTHHQTKYLRREDYLPVGSIVHMEGREFRVDKVDFDKDSVTLQDHGTGRPADADFSGSTAGGSTGTV